MVLDGWRERRRQRQAQAERVQAARQAELERAGAARQAERRRRGEFLVSLVDLRPVEAPGFMPQRNEQAYFFQRGRLFEWKRARGHYERGPNLSSRSA